MMPSPLPVTTFSTRRLTLSNSIGVGSRFLIRSMIGVLAGALISAGSKRWFLTLSVIFVACCAWSAPMVNSSATADNIAFITGTPSELRGDFQLESMVREFGKIEFRVRHLDVAAVQLNVPRRLHEHLRIELDE